MKNRGPSQSSSWQVSIAAVLMLVAGIIHLVIIPHHWEHAPAHGIFMGVIGVVEILWAAAFWLKPGNRLAQVGVLIAVGCITLWGITRIFPAPFGHGPEEVDTSGIISNVLELIAAMILIQVARVRSAQGSDFDWRRTFAVVLLSVVLGFAAYGAARAAEPLFPSLMSTEPMDMNHMDETLPTP